MRKRVRRCLQLKGDTNKLCAASANCRRKASVYTSLGERLSCCRQYISLDNVCVLMKHAV